MKSSLSIRIFAKINKIFADSGMPLKELVLNTGYGSGTARKARVGLPEEHHRPPLSTLESLAKALGVEIKDFP